MRHYKKFRKLGTDAKPRQGCEEKLGGRSVPKRPNQDS